MTKSDSELLAMAQSGDAALLSALSGSAHADAIRDEDGWGLLLTASAAGHAHLVPGLVAAGCRVGSRERDFGRTPLMEAAHKGHWGAVAALLAAGAGVNETDKLGQTALHHATHGNHGKCIELLVNAGADKGARDHAGEPAGK